MNHQNSLQHQAENVTGVDGSHFIGDELLNEDLLAPDDVCLENNQAID